MSDNAKSPDDSGSASSHCYRDMFKRIDWLAGLKVNWDSYGALPMHYRTAEKARLIAKALSETPAINILNDGRVCFSWLDENLEIVVSATGTSIILSDDL